MLNKHGAPIEGAEIRFRINGRARKIHVPGNTVDNVISASDGTYLLEVDVSTGFGPSSIMELRIGKASFQTTGIAFAVSEFARREKSFFLEKNVVLARSYGPAFWVATAVFIAVYLLISFDVLHRAIASMLGMAIMLSVSYTLGTFHPEYRIISFAAAVRKIDHNVIFLLLGMMVIIGILKKTGFFQWAALQCFLLVRGKLMILNILLMSLTAVISSLLDNVTTMLLLAPMTIEIAVTLGISPFVFLIPEILASNIGGTATLIGDPPNIMIGSYAGLTFIDFLKHLTPICLAALAALFFFSKLYHGNEYKKARLEDIEKMISALKTKYTITDRTVLGFGAGILAFVIFLFLTHGYWKMEVSIAALTGASVFLAFSIISKKLDLLKLLEEEIDWATLLSFIFLFILVGCVEETGLLDLIADGILILSRGNLMLAICFIVWTSAIVSAFVDNIPLYGRNAPGDRVSVTLHTRRREQRIVVGSCPGGVFWRQRDNNRGIGKSGDDRDRGRTRVFHSIHRVYEDRLRVHAGQRGHVPICFY